MGMWRNIEQNLIVRIGKSETNLSNNKRLQSQYCTVKALLYVVVSVSKMY